jgi:hypothetical protein
MKDGFPIPVVEGNVSISLDCPIVKRGEKSANEI